MTSATPAKLTTVLYRLMIVGLILVIVILGLRSLHLTSNYDTPVVMYMGYLIDHLGYVPYRDFLDINPPGTHLLGIAFNRITGITDFGYQWLDLLIMFLIMALAWAMQRSYGSRTAWFSALLIGALHVVALPYMRIQRDYIILLPIAFSMWLASSTPRLKLSWRAVGIGMCIGAACTIKPQSALVLPPILLALYAEKSLGWRSLLKIGIYAGIGLAISLGAAFGWLAALGGLPDFLRVVRDYYPIYNTLVYDGNIGDVLAFPIGQSSISLDRHLRAMFATLDTLFLLLPAIGGVLIASRRLTTSPQRRQFLLFIVLGLLFYFYPAISGRYVLYHWQPFIFMLALLLGLCLFAPTRLRLRVYWRDLAVLSLTLILVIIALLTDFALLPFSQHNPEQRLRPIFIEAEEQARLQPVLTYLQANLHAGDKIQPLDMVTGGLQIMLKLRAEIATPYMYDLFFYLHPTEPVVKEQRTDFIRRMKANPPRFILEGLQKMRIHGDGADYRFDELTTLLQTDYTPVVSSAAFILYEHK